MVNTPPFHGGVTSSIFVRAMGLIELIHRINRIPLYNMYLTIEAIALCSLCGYASLIRMSLTKEHNLAKWSSSNDSGL